MTQRWEAVKGRMGDFSPLPRGSSTENEVIVSGYALWFLYLQDIIGAKDKKHMVPGTAIPSISNTDYPKLACELGIRGYQGIIDNFVRCDNGFIRYKTTNKNIHFLELHAEVR